MEVGWRSGGGRVEEREEKSGGSRGSRVTLNQSVTQSLSHSVTRSFGHSVTRSLNHSVTHPSRFSLVITSQELVSLSDHQSISQSIRVRCTQPRDLE